MDDAEHERLCQATFDARDAAWAHLGQTDPHVLAPIINPAFTGGPVWPNLRQAYRIIRGPLGIALASDGLSDPFDDSWANPPPQNGFAVEVYAIADELEGPIVQSWMFQVVAGAANVIAGHGQVHSLLDELGTLSLELDVPIPDEHRERFIGGKGRVGILLGLHAQPVPTHAEGPVSPIRLVNLKLLTASELEHILRHGDDGRQEVTERLRGSQAPLVSSLRRGGVV